MHPIIFQIINIFLNIISFVSSLSDNHRISLLVPESTNISNTIPISKAFFVCVPITLDKFCENKSDFWVYKSNSNAVKT